MIALPFRGVIFNNRLIAVFLCLENSGDIIEACLITEWNMKVAAAVGVTRATQNRKVRQEALRDQLSVQGHVQHVIDIAEKLSDLDEILDALEIQRLRAAAEIKSKLINKYLPDLKSTELTGADGGAIKTDNTWTIKVIE